MSIKAALLAQFQSELWLLERSRLEALLAQVEAMDDATLMARAPLGAPAASSDKPYAVSEGIATLPLRGVMMKSVPWFFGLFGIEATSSPSLEAAIRQAAADPDVRGIHLEVDSPGGMIAGTPELAAAVLDASKQKPVTAHADGTVASAAYWVAAQASRLTVNPSSEVGSIGVMRVMRDTSAVAGARGIKVHVVASHELKGAGVDGAPITPRQIDNAQEQVDQVASAFTAAIATGRRMPLEQAKALSTGQTWLGAEAQKHGLIDGISTTTAAVNSAASAVRPKEPKTPRIAAISNSTPDGVEGEGMEPTKNHAVAGAAPAGDDLAAQLAEMKTRAEKAEAEAAKSAALIDVQKAAVAEAKASAIAAVIDEGARTGRVTPPMREKVEKFAQLSGDVEEVKAFIATLPQQTRAAAVGETPASQGVSTLSGEDARASKTFGNDPKRVEKYGSFAAISLRGEVVLPDGSRLKVQRGSQEVH